MSAAYKRRRALPKDFVFLIFNKEQITLSDCIPVFIELEQNPGPLSRLFSDDDEISLQFLSNFDHYASRMSRFFSMFKKHSVDHLNDTTRQRPWLGPALANELTERLLLPLLGENFSQFSLGHSFLDMFSAILDCCLPYRLRSFEKLGEALLREKSVFAALISGRTGGVVKHWITVFSSMIKDHQTLNAWARLLVDQCESCKGNHDIRQQKQRWQELDTLLPRLTRAHRNHPQPTSTTQRQQPLKLDSDLVQGLQRFGVSAPETGDALQEAIFKLEKDETARILKVAVETYPCRFCYESSTGRESVDLEQNQRDICMRLEFGHFADLLGSGIGMWRVLASSEALEDMQQAYEEGSFNMVESTIMQLASGLWEDPLIRQPFNKDDPFLYLAPYSQNKQSAILWELGAEFDEAEDALLQLIRIWRVGDIKTIEQAEPHIRLIHKTYSEVRLDAHSLFRVDQASGIAYPTSYGKDSNILRGTLELDDKAQRQLGQSLLKFNRFHIVTQTTFSNIRYENLTAEYPLSLAKEELQVVKDSSNSTLIQGRSGTGKTTCLVYKLFGRYIASRDTDAANPPRQVLLTRSPVLSNKLKGYTKRLITTHSSEPDSTAGDKSGLNFMLGDDEREVIDTLFTITSDDFPLVCTFNHFLKLLENTLRDSDRKDFSFFLTQEVSLNSTQKRKEPGRRFYRKSQVVDFEVFSEQYWDKFPTRLVAGMSRTLAFMEIIGVIKGAACYSIDFQPLTRERYLLEGRKISHVEVDRGHMYDIYLHYEKVKRSYGDIDDIDRARDVLNRMAKNPDVRTKILRVLDEIYIDEIQDQRLLEIMLLLHLVKAPNAVHFAGDTAQSISRDSVFRFENVQDFLYARFSSRGKINPYVHRLYKNYRTHQGILNVATSVMNLLCKSFPEMVDVMEDEEGQFSGPKPVMFVGIGSEVLSSSMFGATNLDTDPAQFGADQVIIVRDKSQQDMVRKEIGDFALVLTVLESKGMEFEDVLLLDFFSTSDCSAAWRASQSSSFDPIKHLALCSELKQLYVAITRAQYRLWFFESSASSVKDILTLWRPDVDQVSSNDKNKHEELAKLRPGKNANPEIWSRRGHQFIENKNYESALLCFRRAGDRKGTNLTTALLSERKAKSLLARGDEDACEQYFREAAKLFHECGQGLREASCYEALGEFEKAGDIFAKHHEFSRAAGNYIQANLFEEASDNYILCERYNDAASVLARGDKSDSLVLYLDKHRTKLSPAYQRHYSRLCILLVRRKRVSPELRELATSTLSDKEKEEFYREYEMRGELKNFLMKKRRYSDICKEEIKRGKLDEAWNFDQEYGGMEKLPLKDRVEVYMNRQIEALHEYLSPETNEESSSGANKNPFAFYPLIPECSWLSDSPPIVRFWTNLPEDLKGFWRHEITYESIIFDEPWMKEIFDLTVTFKAHAFVTSALSMTELPIESISTVVNMTKELIIDFKARESLHSFLRITSSRKKVDTFFVLPTSILHGNCNEVTSLKSRAMVDQAVATWTTSCLSRAILKLYQKSEEILRDEKLCLSFLYKGQHSNNSECRLRHQSVAKEEENAIIIEDLIRIASLMHSLPPLFNNEAFLKVANPKPNRKLLGTIVRKSMERLLAGITYISSVEQSPELLKKTWDDITKPNTVLNRGVYGGLADLLFRRLQENLNTICDVSSMLEQLQLAQNLGLRPRFESNLKYTARGRHPRYPTCYPTNFHALSGSYDEKAWYSWNNLQSISKSLQQSKIGYESILALGVIIRNIDCTELRSYHAIIALYEKWATHLIYLCNPRELLLPRSWILLYKDLLPPRFTFPTPETVPIDRRRENLLLLVECFCFLVQKINSWTPTPPLEIQDNNKFQHKLSGKIRVKGQGIHIFARRNFHFLSTCLLNIHSWRLGALNTHLKNRCMQVYKQVDQVLALPFALPFALSPDFRSYAPFANLCRSYINSFAIYKGKDRPQIITATTYSPSSFYRFMPMVLKESFEEWSLPVASEEAPKSTTNIDGSDTTFKDYDGIKPSVIIIQHMWRSRYPIIKKRRIFSNTSGGRVLTFMRDICLNILNDSSFDGKESIRIRSLLFTVGVKIYILSENIERLYKECKDKAKSSMSKEDVSGIEYAQIWWGKLLDIQGKVMEKTSFFSRDNLNSLRKLDSTGLNERMQEVYQHLNHIEIDLKLLDPEKKESTAAIVIQRAFRAQRRILKLRREFRATEAGKTVTYVRRIVVALVIRDPLDRIGEIRRAWVLFNHVVQLIQKVKEVEETYKKVKRAVRFKMNWAGTEEKRNARGLASQLNEIRDSVREEASFLLEANWMQLNIPSRQLEAKCTETWRVLRGIENALSRITPQ